MIRWFGSRKWVMDGWRYIYSMSKKPKTGGSNDNNKRRLGERLSKIV